MALPDYDTIRDYYMSGNWTDTMLRTALVCKAITNEQFEGLLAEKKAAKETAAE